MFRVLALVGALTLLLAAPASAFTKKAMTFHVTTGPDGTTPCKVSADLYTPAGVSKANPAPAVMGTNGFGGSKADFTTLASAYAQRGYIFLAYSGLGFGGSGCKIELDDPDWDGKAGSQLVTWLGQQDDVVKDGPGDPRVGMIGGSYGGQIQFAIAGVDPRMDAIVPQITWNDLSYSLTPNNTDISGVTYATPGVVKIDWPVLFFGLGVGQGFQHAIQDGDPSHIGTCPNFDDRVCPGLVQSSVRGYDDDATLALLRHASVSAYMKRIRIPTFLAQGQSDTLFDLQESVATYRALRAQGTPVKMLWRSAGHSGGDLGAQESSDTNPESAYESRMELEWFDWYLKGVGDPPALDFNFLRDWALPKTGDAAASVGETRSYPGGADRTLYLSGTDGLVSSRSGVAAGTASMGAVPGAPSGTGGGFVDTGGNEAPGTSVAFSTAALGEDTDVMGIPRLTVRLDAPTFAAGQGADALSKLVLFAKLYDVAPDGSLTLPRNLVSAVRVADVTKPLTIELPGIAHRFAKGHKMQLVLSTSDVQYRGNTLGGPVSVATDPASPGILTIPVLGAQTGPSGSGPDGTTPFAAPPGSPPAQKAGAGGPKRSAPSARLPSARKCASRRSFRIHLRRGLRSATVLVNGKRVKVLRGKRLRAPVNLRGLPKGTFRVTVTGRTTRGRTLRAARTYHTCVPRKTKKKA
jgi:ABC-2 type transport system ATP-binding protein